MRLGAGNDYQFEHVTLTFDSERYSNVFALKNNKTLRQTLQHPRYSKLLRAIEPTYVTHLDQPLGDFLLSLKLTGDALYKKFLNRYGDGTFLSFRLGDPALRSRFGIYAYRVKNQIMYIGRCKDSLSKRIDQGYGKIHPKNCYLDGQATNCHLNGRIAADSNAVELWFCSLQSPHEIDLAERELIRTHSPSWNLQRYL